MLLQSVSSPYYYTSPNGLCEAGCDYIDVGMEPLSWGTGHADLLSVQAMLKDAGYQLPEINMEALSLIHI